MPFAAHARQHRTCIRHRGQPGRQVFGQAQVLAEHHVEAQMRIGRTVGHEGGAAREQDVVAKRVLHHHLPEGDPTISLVSGKQQMEGPQLEGHATQRSLLARLPEREITGDRAVGEWVVRAPKGTHIALSARADRAGVVRTEVSLD